jgi:hypothetical protein
MNQPETRQHRPVEQTRNEGNNKAIAQQQASIQQNQIDQQNQKAAAICVFLLVMRGGLSS